EDAVANASNTRSANATPAIDYGDFRSANPAAFSLLALFGWFGGTDIPGDLIRRHAAEAIGDDRLAAALADEASWQEAFRILAEYALISGDHDQVSVHDSVRAAIRGLADPEACAIAVRMLAAEFPRDTSDPATWPLCDRLAKHATQAAESA